MAYAQKPRHGGPQRPYYEHLQTSYAAPQQAYAAEYNYEPGNQGNGYNEDSGHGAKHQYQDAYAPQEGVYGGAYDQNGWQNGGGPSYGNDNHHEDKAHNRGVEKPPARHPQQRPVEDDRRARSDHRSRGQPRSKSRPPERDRYYQQDPHYQSNQHHKTRDHRQQHRPEPEPDFFNGPPRQANGAYAYDEATYEPQDNWPTSQHDGLPENGSRPRQIHEQISNHQQQGYSDGYGHGNPQGNAPDLEPTGAPLGQLQSKSAQSQKEQRRKPPHKRILAKPASPETVAWDNPFPSWKPKKATHSSSQSLDGTVAAMSLHDESRYPDSRPQTANSKSSYGSLHGSNEKANGPSPQNHSIPQSRHLAEPVANSSSQDQDYFYKQPQPQRDAERYHMSPQDQPRTREKPRAGGRVDQLRPRMVAGRHSEDNRTRPSIANDTAVDLGYERSRTMPAAVSQVVVNHAPQIISSGPSEWQEPGPIAGYYGPEGTGYLPQNPQDLSLQQRSHDQPRAISEDSRPPQKIAVAQVKVQETRQPHTPQDSLGDFFDTYYDETQHDYQPHLQNKDRQHQSPSDEGLPNFDAVPELAASHRRGMTIDDHLQPQQRPQDYPPLPAQLPAPPQDKGRGNRGNVPYTGQLPRSRSQPDLKDRRSPKPQHNNGFDFGIPGAFDRPPTAPSRNEYGAAISPSIGHPDGKQQNWDQPPKSRAYQEPTPAAGYRGNDRNRSNGPPPMAYHANAQPDRYRSPPLQNGPPPMAYQANAQPDRYRSPPLQNGPPPVPYQDNAQPDRYRSPPLQNGPPILPYQSSAQLDRYRLPPSQNGGPPDGQTRQYGTGPSPINRTGPTSPPDKSPPNPDALPRHPAPVRPGLMDSSPVNQSAKPAPIRQYDATPSPMQLSDPTQKPGSSRGNDAKPESGPVTYEELERLKQATLKKPSDQATQLLLAKKMVEAASVLVDQRADPKARNKSREKYIFDAHKLVKKLSDNGYSEANFYLADCHSRGSLGLETDTRQAFKLYQSAAKLNHAQAAYRVAVCCEMGHEEGGGTSRDPVKAMQWYKRAATLGDTPAMYKMGIIQLKGLLGQAKNPREALVYLKKAAERADRENPHALHELGLLHEKGSEGVPKDEAYSKQLFTQAANLGYKFSQFRLGCAYEYGLMGCPVDPRQSIAWYSKAAVQEEHQSELALSGWYLTGSEGVLQQSDTEAYLWARKAAQAGLAKAEYAMGYFTEVGIGAPANMEDAKRWYWRSASQNFQKARDRLEDLRKGGAVKQKSRVSRSAMKKQSDGECVIM